MATKNYEEIFRPKGVYPALLTPFNDEGKVNEEELKRLVNWLIEEGVHGIFPLGSGGEAIYLSFEERVRVVEVVLEAADSRVPVTPGASDSCAKNTIAFAKKIKELGCAGAVICPPYYLPISQDSLLRHYEEIVKELPDFPVILYNIPAFSTAITYDIVEKLSKYSNVVSMKDSSGSMVDFLHFMDKGKIDGNIDVMTGREETLFPTLMMGGKGTFPAAVGIVPEIMVGIYNSEYLKMDIIR